MKERIERVSNVKRTSWFVAALLLTALKLSACTVPALSLLGSAAAPAPAAVAVVVPTAAISLPAANAGTLDALQGTLEQVYKQVNPSVVSAAVIESVSTSNLTPQIAQAMTLPSNLAGVLVETVEPGGPATRRGCAPAPRS